MLAVDKASNQPCIHAVGLAALADGLGVVTGVLGVEHIDRSPHSFPAASLFSAERNADREANLVPSFINAIAIKAPKCADACRLFRRPSTVGGLNLEMEFVLKESCSRRRAAALEKVNRPKLVHEARTGAAPCSNAVTRMDFAFFVAQGPNGNPHH
jgi:hypothetical protein